MYSLSRPSVFFPRLFFSPPPAVVAFRCQLLHGRSGPLQLPLIVVGVALRGTFRGVRGFLWGSSGVKKGHYCLSPELINSGGKKKVVFLDYSHGPRDLSGRPSHSPAWLRATPLRGRGPLQVFGASARTDHSGIWECRLEPCTPEFWSVGSHRALRIFGVLARAVHSGILL